jgi:hypothetical protein
MKSFLESNKGKTVSSALLIKGAIILLLGIVNQALELRANLLEIECKESVSASLKANGVSNYKYLALNFCIGGNTAIDTKSIVAKP